MYLNDVKLIGEVRDDAELKPLANGGAILNFTLVTTERFKDYKGEPIVRKEAFRVVAFNNIAKNTAPEGRLPAGTEVLVEGFLRSHTEVIEVIIRRLQIVQTQGCREANLSEG
ncbi:MAG: single-stranded DNA-binding protein [Clostridiales bacterium]|nr:single-stranded DNA-binding protein [Clostridiales bacterium]